MSIEDLKTRVAREFGTPAVVVDLDVVERNIARVQVACDNAGVRLFVVKQNRHNATLQLLKRAVENNRFGKI